MAKITKSNLRNASLKLLGVGAGITTAGLVWATYSGYNAIKTASMPETQQPLTTNMSAIGYVDTLNMQASPKDLMELPSVLEQGV